MIHAFSFTCVGVDDVAGGLCRADRYPALDRSGADSTAFSNFWSDAHAHADPHAARDGDGYTGD